jgi:hypothetical protein
MRDRLETVEQACFRDDERARADGHRDVGMSAGSFDIVDRRGAGLVLRHDQHVRLGSVLERVLRLN